MREAAERGRLIHALFERLPPVAPALRAASADRWLRHAGGVDDPAVRATLVADVLAIVEDPRFATLFGAGSLAEAPIAATVADGVVVSGTVDRLLVGDDLVRLVDFKTAAAPPPRSPRYRAITSARSPPMSPRLR